MPEICSLWYVPGNDSVTFRFPSGGVMTMLPDACLPPEAQRVFDTARNVYLSRDRTVKTLTLEDIDL